MSDEKRKVVMTEYYLITGDPKSHSREHEGLFHKWGYEIDCGTVAIVELSDGSIQTPLPEHVKFMDAPNA